MSVSPFYLDYEITLDITNSAGTIPSSIFNLRVWHPCVDLNLNIISAPEDFIDSYEYAIGGEALIVDVAGIRFTSSLSFCGPITLTSNVSGATDALVAGGTTEVYQVYSDLIAGKPLVGQTINIQINATTNDFPTEGTQFTITVHIEQGDEADDPASFFNF